MSLPSLSHGTLDESHAFGTMRSLIRAATPVICVAPTLFAREKDLVHHFTSYSQESDSSPYPSKADQQADGSTNSSPLDSAKSAGPDCEFYNSFQQRFAWAERRNRCNAESGCNFRGRRFTGSCELESKAKANSNLVCHPDAAASNAVINFEVLHKLETDTSTKGASSGGDLQTKAVNKVEVEIVGSGDMGFAPPLHILINETLTSSAVDSIRDSRQLANELAKSLLIEVLERKENRGKFGELLLYLFVSDTVLSPTRHTIYWTLTLDNTIKNIVSNVEIHRDYWLGFTENYDRSMRSIKKLHTRHEGRLITDVMLMNQVILWLEDPLTRTAVLTPLIEWTLQQDEIVKFPLTDLAVDFLPWIKVSTALMEPSIVRQLY